MPAPVPPRPKFVPGRCLKDTHWVIAAASRQTSGAPTNQRTRRNPGPNVDTVECFPRPALRIAADVEPLPPPGRGGVAIVVLQVPDATPLSALSMVRRLSATTRACWVVRGSTCGGVLSLVIVATVGSFVC